MQALAEHRARAQDLLTRRLESEFGRLSATDVRRCVDEVRARMVHLGVDATPELVERMAREQLTGLVKSEPPSGPARRPAGPDGGR